MKGIENKYLIISIVWMVLIWTISSLPSSELPSFQVFGFDKIAHFSIYMIWGLLVNKHLLKVRTHIVTSIAIYSLMCLCASLDEWHQHYIPGRSVNVYDLLANLFGLITSLVTLTIQSKIGKSDFSKRSPR
jgi:VanZ family protein